MVLDLIILQFLSCSNVQTTGNPWIIHIVSKYYIDSEGAFDSANDSKFLNTLKCLGESRNPHN